MRVPPPSAGESDLDRYEIVRLLGRGGMGEVYLARDRVLPRDVAIKFITSEQAADRDARRRLLHEARAAAALDHPGICTVYDTGETADGRAYIVMQYVPGEPLADVLQRGPLPVRDALALCADVADALHTAHAHNVIHRDLKPGNVIVTPGGRPKLVDFGIAKSAILPPDAADADTASALTTAGAIVGTIGYMSPEQVQQRPLDGRSDLFSLGALLFECLTGSRAFRGATPIETLGKVLHVQTPAPSRLRPGLDDRHDELCLRLLAKDPADRFQSAQQVVGAIRLLLPDTSRTSSEAGGHHEDDRAWAFLRRPASLLLAAVAVLTIATAAFWLRPSAGPPQGPPDAEYWYRRGTDALREGAYYTATKALGKAVEIFPEHVLAYARLAEAHAELDDHRLAQENLLRVQLPARLSKEERLRIEAIKALVTRDLEAAIAGYAELAQLRSDDAGAWLDLGRAQEAAGLRNDARTSYARAVQNDPEYAPAYVRLGFVDALNSRRDEALAAFARAERLYQQAVDMEGLTEVLLRRGAMYDSFNELKNARADLERALARATDVNATNQQVRARLALSSVTASEGRFSEAVREADAAIQDALTHGLETVAADGLIDLAFMMQSPQAGASIGERLVEAEAHAKRAVQLAENRDARRTAARAKLQLATIYGEQHRPAEALALLSDVLPFLKENRYRRFELLGLSIASRAHLALDQLEQARQISSSVLSVAETLRDEAQVALAASNLASVLTALGHYPAALLLRHRAEEIRARQGDEWSIPYDLGNRADLLIRLGRAREAAEPLAALETGIAAGKDSYVNRRRHAIFLHALAAATSLQCQHALPGLRRLSTDESATDTPGLMGRAIEAFCQARMGRHMAVELPQQIDPTTRRERQYWVAAAALQVENWPRALAEATLGLKLLGEIPNDELRWRLAAVGALAAGRVANQNQDTVARLSEMMNTALTRLQVEWSDDFSPYAQRADLVDLRRRVEQLSRNR